MSLNSTEKREIRRFGAIAMIFFGCLCALGVWRDKPIPVYLFGSLSAMGLAFCLFPLRLRAVHSGWLKIAQLMGKLTNIIFLTIAYYIVITPSALIKRFRGGPPLPLKPDKNAATYWVDRAEPAQPRERFIKRY